MFTKRCHCRLEHGSFADLLATAREMFADKAPVTVRARAAFLTALLRGGDLLIVHEMARGMLHSLSARKLSPRDLPALLSSGCVCVVRGLVNPSLEQLQALEKQQATNLANNANRYSSSGSHSTRSNKSSEAAAAAQWPPKPREIRVLVDQLTELRDHRVSTSEERDFWRLVARCEDEWRRNSEALPDADRAAVALLERARRVPRKQLKPADFDTIAALGARRLPVRETRDASLPLMPPPERRVDVKIPLAMRHEA